MNLYDEYVDYYFEDMFDDDGVQTVGNTCPKCGCQINSPFNPSYRIHDIEKCTGIIKIKKDAKANKIHR